MANELTAYKLQRIHNNMDAVRYFLSMSVIVAHFNFLCGISVPWPVSHIGVPGFFTLSGFLIFRSYEKAGSFKTFVKKRARRILPPYMVCVLLCAFFLSFASSLSFGQYFSSPQFYKYLFSNLTFMNFLEPGLPGVFEGDPFRSSAVDGALWTMKIEWCFYLTVPIIYWAINKVRHKLRYVNLILITIIFLSILYRIGTDMMYRSTGNYLYIIIGRQFVGQLSFFYLGSLVYFNLDKFLKYKYYVLGVLILGAIFVYFNSNSKVVLDPLMKGGFVLWFSMVGEWGHYLSRHDNVSYDMYLYHFPLIQIGVLLGLPQLGTWPCFLIGVAVIIGFAFLTRNIIGRIFFPIKRKPVLK